MKYLCLFLLLATAHCLSRRLTMEKTPGCSNCNYNVYHVKAEGPNDTIHYVWDFTTKPTVFVAVTHPNAMAYFNWTTFLTDRKSINFYPLPKYTFILVLNKFIQFNDVEDTGVLTPETDSISFDTRHFKWKPVAYHIEEDEENTVGLNIIGCDYHGKTMLNGKVHMQLTAFGLDGHDTLQPRLVHSTNTTQCRITLEGLKSSADFNSTRYAIQFLMLSSDLCNETSKIQSRMNLDDENSPGVFSIIDVMTPKSLGRRYEGAFLQWRPVAFTNEIPSLVNSTEVLVYNLTRIDKPEENFRGTLVYKYYGPNFADNLLQQTVVSIGFAEDGFYKKTNYSSWTFTVNYGSPEREKLSLLVITVMAIGLGFPAVLVLMGGSYMLFRRFTNKDRVPLAS